MANNTTQLYNDSADDGLSNTIQLRDKIRSWIIHFKVSHNSANHILNIMKSEGLDVPKDVRTLMRTPKTHEIVSLGPGDGSYIHYGLKNMLSPLLTKYINYIDFSNTLKLGVNVDGLPLSKSSKSQLWPILISVINSDKISNIVLPIGIYHGTKKPINIETFFRPFIIDISSLLDTGMTINGIDIRFEIGHIVCDAPAKAFLLNVKGHNAYFGCTSCVQEGTYIQNRVVFLDVNSSLRTNESFRNKIDEDHHKGCSPLEQLPINITDTVCLDYMHNVCLGVVKRLIEYWVRGKKDVRLTNDNCSKISEDLINLRVYIPYEFSRLPRKLEDIEYWKATELRSFLLYFGTIVLKHRLKKEFYLHFLLLSCAIKILVSPQICQVFNNLADGLLQKFVILYSSLYGDHLVSYNVHNLLHLPRFVKIHGSLDNFSCFKYENYLQEIKKSIKSAKYPLQEITNRIKEKQNIFITTPLKPFHSIIVSKN